MIRAPLSVAAANMSFHSLQFPRQFCGGIRADRAIDWKITWFASAPAEVACERLTLCWICRTATQIAADDFAVARNYCNYPSCGDVLKTIVVRVKAKGPVVGEFEATSNGFAEKCLRYRRNSMPAIDFPAAIEYESNFSNAILRFADLVCILPQFWLWRGVTSSQFLSIPPPSVSSNFSQAFTNGPEYERRDTQSSSTEKRRSCPWEPYTIVKFWQKIPQWCNHQCKTKIWSVPSCYSGSFVSTNCKPEKSSLFTPRHRRLFAKRTKTSERRNKEAHNRLWIVFWMEIFESSGDEREEDEKMRSVCGANDVHKMIFRINRIES